MCGCGMYSSPFSSASIEEGGGEGSERRSCCRKRDADVRPRRVEAWIADWRFWERDWCAMFAEGGGWSGRRRG